MRLTDEREGTQMISTEKNRLHVYVAQLRDRILVSCN
jgi:hypothetical protein